MPQGSPLSPVLFLLYTEPIYRLGDPKRRFGYADDVADFTPGDSLEETAATATAKLDEILAWGRENAVQFDVSKTEMKHFSWDKKSGASPPIYHDGAAGHEKSAPLRWLGVYFDRRLNFQAHVDTWANSARRVGNHL